MKEQFKFDDDLVLNISRDSYEVVDKEWTREKGVYNHFINRNKKSFNYLKIKQINKSAVNNSKDFFKLKNRFKNVFLEEKIIILPGKNGQDSVRLVLTNYENKIKHNFEDLFEYGEFKSDISRDIKNNKELIKLIDVFFEYLSFLSKKRCYLDLLGENNLALVENELGEVELKYLDSDGFFYFNKEEDICTGNFPIEDIYRNAFEKVRTGWDNLKKHLK